MYRKSVWCSGDKNFLVVKKYHALYCQPKSEKNKNRRKPKHDCTDWRQEEVNRRRRTENVQRLLLDNFRPGDFYITLTYKTGALPETEQQAKDDFNKMKRRIRSFYTKKKLACTWIGIIEHLRGGGRTHMHIMVPALDPLCIADIKKMWPHGNVDVRFYGGSYEDAYRLARYYTKETTEKHASSVMSSRNLLRTAVKKKTVTADTWADKVTPPAGYEICEKFSYKTDTESGYPLQITVFTKINPVYLPRPPLAAKKKKKRRGKQNESIKNDEEKAVPG